MSDIEFSVKDIEGIGDDVVVLSVADVEDPDPNGTGSYSLDCDLVRAFPYGRLTEVYGDEGSGKSTLVLEAIGQALSRGHRALYLNMEKNLNRSLLASIRTIVPFLEKKKDNPFQVAKANCGEDAFNIARRWAEVNPNSIVVLDSVDACIPRDMIAGNIGDKNMGGMGKLMSEACRALVHAIEANNVCFIFVNQLREKVGMTFGDPRVTPGGRALRFYSTQRILLKAPAKDCYIKGDTGEPAVGHWVRYDIVKNKVAPDGVSGKFPILYGRGIDRETELIDMCLKFGILGMGGRGGRQVKLPVLVDNQPSDEFITIKKADAAARIRNIDTELVTFLDTRLQEVLNPK